MSDAATYQSLYRRFRPQRFDELRGQDHIVRALRNAVRDEKVAHAYLFSGPRGTGKTTTARVLAKALNCTGIKDGEPDNTCESCLQIAAGSSLDVHELDAASNNGVEAMRDLVSRAALGTPGRWKVYIVDEVHMLSNAASNALLKTLEEPPSQVVFILATTDPQKVLPTIRSRTQHFEFKLLDAQTLSELAESTIKAAGLDVPNQAIDLVVRRGKGSARDALSALDQIAAAGIVDDECDAMVELTEAVIERDAGRALVSIAGAMRQGTSAQRIATDFLEYLRNGFLSLMARNLVELTDEQSERVEAQARQMGTPRVVRAMELMGESLVGMRDSLEPRVDLEVAFTRLCKPQLDNNVAALVERIERLESGGVNRPDVNNLIESPKTEPESAPVKQPAPRVSRNEAPAPAPARSAVTAPPSRRSFAAARQQIQPQPEKQPQNQKQQTEQKRQEKQTETNGVKLDLTQQSVEQQWKSSIFDALPTKIRPRFKIGRIVKVENNAITFAFPNFAHRMRCEEVQNDVAMAFSKHFGRPVTLKLVDDETQPGTPGANANATNGDPGSRSENEYNVDDHVYIEDTIAAKDAKEFSVESRLKAAFPGSEEIN